MTVPEPTDDLGDLTYDLSGGPAVETGFTHADPDGGPERLGQNDALTEALGLAESRLADLARERAEFVNYRRRAERDIAAATSAGVAALVEGLLPVLDDIRLAREHGDLDGTPFAAIAEKLDATLTRFGVESYGQPGDVFDPAIHEALVHDNAAGDVEIATCTRILAPGYRLGARTLRPARVAVAEPV